MSETITLTCRGAVESPLEVDGLTPDRLAGLAEAEIASLGVRAGTRVARLGDFFTVRGGRSDRVRIEGTLDQVHGLGSGLASGELVIDGSAGDRVGAQMTGGTLHVLGRVGHDAGVAMAGGVLQVDGSAGDRLGGATPGAARGMTGGEIVVRGSAGAEAAMRARRGLVVVGGDAGDHAARAIIAGTLVVFGRTGADPGRGSKRGSIIAIGGIPVPATYAYACTFAPPVVCLLMTYLARRFGITAPLAVVHGRYRRYCGDAGQPGKGEILEWIGE